MKGLCECTALDAAIQVVRCVNVEYLRAVVNGHLAANQAMTVPHGAGRAIVMIASYLQISLCDQLLMKSRCASNALLPTVI